MRPERTIRSGRQTVTMRHDRGEDESTVAKDFARSFAAFYAMWKRGAAAGSIGGKAG